ncbi:MAG: hypothetical protein LBD23_04315, partial [Oscillospiraceae bacterium]|nr:hypothetical protein [Oscillospiraceae bacterium]
MKQVLHCDTSFKRYAAVSGEMEGKMIFLKPRKKYIVMLPEEMLTSGYIGKINGIHYEETGVFNIFDEATANAVENSLLGEITEDTAKTAETGKLIGIRTGEELKFTCDDEEYEIKPYNLVQNVFSRNTGI